MKKKKKRGSTVLTILAVTMVLMLLGGILLNVIMSTTEGNENKKIRQDLKYGAESGLEIARSYLAQKGYKEAKNNEIQLAIQEKAKVLIEDNTPESNITEIEIKLMPVKKSVNNTEILVGVEIESKAKHIKNGKNNEEKMKCKVRSGHNGNFMDHGLVGGSGGIQMDDTGHIDLGNTSVSVGEEGDGLDYPGNANVTKPKPENEHLNSFGELKFKSEGRLSKIEAEILDIGELKFINLENVNVEKVRVKIETVDGKTTTSIEGSMDTPKEYMEKLVAPVIKIEVIDGAKGDNMYMYDPKIYVINSEDFNMRFDTAKEIYNTVIINTGKMEVEGNGSLKMMNSTFIANKIKTGMKVSFDMIGQPNKVDNNVSDDNVYGVFSEEEEKALSELINVLIPNWSENNTGGNDYNGVEGGSYE